MRRERLAGGDIDFSLGNAHLRAGMTGHSTQPGVHCLALDGAAERKDALKRKHLKKPCSERGRRERS